MLGGKRTLSEADSDASSVNVAEFTKGRGNDPKQPKTSNGPSKPSESCGGKPDPPVRSKGGDDQKDSVPSNGSSNPFGCCGLKPDSRPRPKGGDDRDDSLFDSLFDFL